PASPKLAETVTTFNRLEVLPVEVQRQTGRREGSILGTAQYRTRCVSHRLAALVRHQSAQVEGVPPELAEVSGIRCHDGLEFADRRSNGSGVIAPDGVPRISTDGEGPEAVPRGCPVDGHAGIVHCCQREIDSADSSDHTREEG